MHIRTAPSATAELQRRLDLSDDEAFVLIYTLEEMADNGNIRAGYRCKRISEQSYKLTKTTASTSTQRESEPPKGLPLPPPSESLTEANNEQIPTNDPFPAVPAELKARPQWLVWKNETRDGKPTKIPYQPEGKKAQSNQSNTWTDYRTAASHRDRFSGIGFVFSENDPYCGIDLDNCLDDNGKVKAWAEPIIERLKPVAYGEVSPSSKGIKFWTRAVLPENAKHKAYIDTETGEAIEVYYRGRFFTVTGKGQGALGGGAHAVNWLVQEYLKHEPLPQPRKTRAAPSGNLKSADEVISHIRESKQCHKFDALMEGKITGYGSQSEADLALCGVIGFWTQDEGVIDSIFRTSKLMRPKWDERHKGDGATYGQMTITEALSGNRETYQPRRQIRRRSRRGRAAAAPGKRYP